MSHTWRRSDGPDRAKRRRAVKRRIKAERRAAHKQQLALEKRRKKGQRDA